MSARPFAAILDSLTRQRWVTAALVVSERDHKVGRDGMGRWKVNGKRLEIENCSVGGTPGMSLASVPEDRRPR